MAPPPAGPPVPPWVVDDSTAYLYFVYHYRPSVPLAWNALLAFSAVALASLVVTVVLHIAIAHRDWKAAQHAHLHQPPHYHYRMWPMYLIPLTAGMEALGYYFRIDAAHNANVGNLTTSLLFLLVPPILSAVVDYVTVGQLLTIAGKMSTLGCLHPQYIAAFFLTADVLCLGVQGSAAPYLTNHNVDQALKGQKIVVAGLALQLFVFVVFGCIAIAAAMLPAYHKHGVAIASGWRIRLIFARLLTSIGLLLLRNCYRLYEFVYERDLLTSTVAIEIPEWQFYAFDAIPIFVCYSLLTIFHFGFVMPGIGQAAENARWKAANSTAASQRAHAHAYTAKSTAAAAPAAAAVVEMTRPGYGARASAPGVPVAPNGEDWGPPRQRVLSVTSQSWQ